MPIAVPVLTMADNQDGTGTVATITGADASATLSLYTQEPSETGWTLRGSRTGNGTISLALTITGYRHAHILSVLGAEQAVSNIVTFFPITQAADAVHYRCVLAVESGIKTLAAAGDLPELTADRVYREITLEPAVFARMTLPGIIVGPTGLETLLPGLNVRDDIGYPVPVFFVDRASGEETGRMKPFLLWRERIHRYFRHQRLSGVPEIWMCAVEPGPTFDIPKELEYQFLLSSTNLRFTSREPRGV